MKQAKIAFVVSGLEYGGVEKYVVDLVNTIDIVKFFPVIFCLTHTGPIQSLIQKITPVYEFHKRKGNDPIVPFRMASVLRRERIDIIHSNNWSTYIEAVLAKLISGRSVLLHVQHGLEMNDAEAVSRTQRAKRNRIRQILSLFTDQIAAVSNATKRFVTHEWKVPEKKVKLIYNGVHIHPLQKDNMIRHKIRNEFGIHKEDIVIGSVGRLSPVKNYAFLLKSFQIAAEQIPNMKLLIVGDGPEREQLLSMIDDSRTVNKVFLPGNRSDVQNLLASMDIFVMPSISEGISLAILEAMSFNLPIIATRVGGNPEILGNKGEYGMLIQSNNVEELASAIKNLATDTEQRNLFGKLAHMRVNEKFSLQPMITSYETEYHRLLSKHFGNHSSFGF